MKILINTAHQRFGGAVQVALSFIEECRRFTDNEYHVFLGPGISKLLDEEIFSKNFFFYQFNFGEINILKILRIQKELKKIEKKIKPDIIISTSGPTYFHSDSPQIIGFNLPLYIYPESPYVKNLSLRKRIKFELKKSLHKYYFKRDAIAFVVQTEDVNKRVRKELNSNKVFTVSNTYNGYFKEPKKLERKLSSRAEGELRFLTISAYYPHKNLEIIPQVVKELKRKSVTHIKFVLTLNKVDFDNHIGNHPNIINLGPVKPDECPSLYNECDFLFLPTLAECFSASYAEAMIMEKPIITTDLGFARSICGDAALFYQAGNPLSATSAIEQLVKDEKLQKLLIKNGLAQVKKFDDASLRSQKYLKICSQFSK